MIKQLKRERSSVFHCICSILDDAAFVAEVRGLYPDVPAVANLRCGLWYVSPPVDHTCYFKSTDGHVGQWAFSTVRLNLHVAHLAAQHGGALIVDATRNANKGGFPDALSRTIPIWAAVLNRAVARARRVEAAPAAGDAPAGAAACAPEGGGAGAAWDQGLHLPLWASRNEVQQVTARLDGWVDLLMSTHPQAVHDLAKVRWLFLFFCVCGGGIVCAVVGTTRPAKDSMVIRHALDTAACAGAGAAQAATPAVDQPTEPHLDRPGLCGSLCGVQPGRKGSAGQERRLRWRPPAGFCRWPSRVTWTSLRWCW